MNILLIKLSTYVDNHVYKVIYIHKYVDTFVYKWIINKNTNILILSGKLNIFTLISQPVKLKNHIIHK